MSYAEMQQETTPLESARESGAEPSSGLRAEWLVLGSVLLASSGQLTIKLGLNRHTGAAVSFGSLHISWLVLLGLAVYAMGTVLWIQAVAKRDISYVYPMSALTYTLVALGGSLLLGETVGWDRWAGIAVMSLGVGLLMGSRDEVRR